MARVSLWVFVFGTKATRTCHVARPATSFQDKFVRKLKGQASFVIICLQSYFMQVQRLHELEENNGRFTLQPILNRITYQLFGLGSLRKSVQRLLTSQDIINDKQHLHLKNENTHKQTSH